MHGVYLTFNVFSSDTIILFIPFRGPANGTHPHLSSYRPNYS